MAELSPEARALLAAAAGADDATPEQRARADAAARIALALHGVTDLPPLDPPAGHGALNRVPATTAKLGTAASWKLAVGAGMLIAAGLLGTRALHSPSQTAPRSTAVQLPVATAAGARAQTAVPADRPAPRSTVGLRAGRVQVEPPAHATQPTQAPQATRALAGGRAAPTLQAEVAMIASANGLIRAQHFAEARRVLARHARRFPRGALREERAALLVLTACQTGSREQALRAMQRFLRTAPQSVLAQRVRAACTTAPEPAW
jgi:hypothetical protein